MLIKKFVFPVLIGLHLVGCQTSDTSSSTSGVLDLGSLPKATSPVRSSTSAFLMTASTLFTSSTGVKMKTAHSASWTASKSRPMCEIARIARDAYLHAATPDALMCIVSVFSNNKVFGDSVYDGNFKYYKFDAGGEVAGARLKFNASKTSGAVTTFNMFICQGSGDTYTQSGYVGQDVSNIASVSMTSIFKAGSSNIYGARSSLTGAITSAGAWTSKQITSITTSTISSKTFTSKSTIDQYEDRIKVNSFMKGDYSNDTFTNRLFAVAQIINPDSLATMAIGDGSARYILSFARTGSNSQSYNSTKSWTGDDQLPISNPSSNGAYYSTVASETPRTTESVEVTFSTDETWDCNAASGGSFSELILSKISAQLVIDVASCVEKYVGNYHDYIDCYSATGE